MGARLRLKRSWYDANQSSFYSAARVLLNCLFEYGTIVADLSDNGFWIEGVNDERWDHDDLTQLRTIPVSAFEVIDTIKPPITLVGPSHGVAGAPLTYVMTEQLPGNTNFTSSLYPQVSADGGTTWTTTDLSSDYFLWSDASRGPFTFTFTPPSTGTFILRIDNGGRGWIIPHAISVAVYV